MRFPALANASHYEIFWHLAPSDTHLLLLWSFYDLWQAPNFNAYTKIWLGEERLREEALGGWDMLALVICFVIQRRHKHIKHNM